MTDMALGFQPALAPTFDQVVPAMEASHDALILRAGRARASGVSWEVYGPELAGVLARTLAAGSAHGPNISGTFTEGLAKLAWHLAGSAAGGLVTPEALADAIRSPTVLSEAVEDSISTFVFAAQGLAYPTLIIAYCQVRVRTGSRR